MAPRLLNIRPQTDAVEDNSDVDLQSRESLSDGNESPASDDPTRGEDDLSEDDLSEDDLSEENVEEDEDTDTMNGRGSYEQQLSHVSFGALKQAQDALSRKRKRGSDTNADQEEKLGALRARLQQIKNQKASNGDTPQNNSQDNSKGRTNKHANYEDGSEQDSNSDSGPSEEDALKVRSSKHAPTAQSSRHQVTRKRQVVDVPKRVVRDPRFDALHRSSAHPGNSEKAYSFLRDYEKLEIAELKDSLKRAKSEEDKEKLKRKIGSMENKLKARAAKEREQEVIRKHRREEKAKIEQGKTPYYLKKKDAKEQALVEKFKGMRGKDREKLIERRRRKEGQKEKKRMPDARRFATGSNAVQSRS